MYQILIRKNLEQCVAPAMSQCENANLYGDSYKYSSTAESLQPPGGNDPRAPMDTVVGCCEGVNEPSSSLNGTQFDYLSDCHLTDPTP
jgi:hypothetical protein